MARILRQLTVRFEGTLDANGVWSWIAERVGEVEGAGEIPPRFSYPKAITDFASVQAFLDTCRSECKTECNAS